MNSAGPQPTGLSSQAIHGWGIHHPWDPADMLRCIRYCEAAGLSTDQLRDRMAGKSVEWDRLLPEWDRLVELLRHEMATRTDGKATRTYQEMERVLAGGTECAACQGAGRGEPCAKCKGTGRRGGGQCRADRCFRGADLCPNCRGAGFTIEKEAAA